MKVLAPPQELLNPDKMDMSSRAKAAPRIG